MGDAAMQIQNAAVPVSGDSEVAKFDEKPEVIPCEKIEQVSPVAQRESEINRPKTNDDVQRAIDGLKDIPDEELQEFLDDEDFMEGLDVVDAWEGEEEKRPATAAKSRSRSKEIERRRTSRDRNRCRDHRSPNNREKQQRRDDRRREENRRDPSKSTKDIERDKMRTLRDSESKILAEKKKAIKSLLDSDNVVPPGTEMEAIETIAEKQTSTEKPASSRSKRSRERRKSPGRRRSTERGRRSPHRRWSPIVISPERRRSPLKLGSPVARRSPLRLSPLVLSPERRRSMLRLSPTHPRRLSWERRMSAEEKQRRSAERHRRHDRDHRRRSRSRDRHRSRSNDRHRRRYSRSPGERRSPRWRSRSGSRGRSPQKRARKRSPFINEIRRQFRNESNQQQQQAPSTNLGFVVPPLMGGMPPMQPPIYPHDQEHQNYMPLHQPGPQGMMMLPGGPHGFMNFDPVHQHMQPNLNYNPNAPQPLMQTDFSSTPVMYGQNSAPARPPLLPLPVPSPQPVPAPSQIDQGTMMYNQTSCIPLQPLFSSTGQQQLSDMSNRRSSSPRATSVRSNTPRSYKGDRRSTTPYNGMPGTHEGRLRTPEPPVISNSKGAYGKTSLSSLLEASVSAKDSIVPPVLYPGFKPEILRHCEHALRDLPIEDPRLKMKGRFFFNPKIEDKPKENKERSSNSILLRKGKNKIYWDEEEERHSQISVKPGVHMHQKICQTDEVQIDHKQVQATVTTADIGIQVYPYELQPSPKEEKRPIMDRLDWNMRETYDYAPKPREADDLRWSLSNSSQKRPWGRAPSPARESDSRSLSRERVTSGPYPSRNLSVCTPTRSREEFPLHRGPLLRDNFSHDTFAPNYMQDVEDRQEHFLDNMSDHSRGESPMVLDDSPEAIEVESDVFRSSERIVISKHQRGGNGPFKGHGAPRGGRPFRGGRGTFRDKF